MNDFSQVPPWVFDLPPINATLNAICTVLLVCGWICIKRDLKKAHIAFMITALITSVAFLSCYLTYHSMLHQHAGDASIRFTHQGAVRPVYFAILIPHVILAAVNLPMIILTVIPAIRRRFDKHRRIARWTLPIWLYVSVTGVLVYLMLYRWFPSDMLTLIPK
ncbi:MAG: putative membrane protein [Verrucomicrobiales bacterium]|jgi:putative membrane protein